MDETTRREIRARTRNVFLCPIILVLNLCKPLYSFRFINQITTLLISVVRQEILNITQQKNIEARIGFQILRLVFLKKGKRDAHG